VAAPIFTVQHMLGESNSTAPEGANDCTFEQWVATQNGDLVLHNNDFVVPIMDALTALWGKGVGPPLHTQPGG
jgi:hypothetical protein